MLLCFCSVKNHRWCVIVVRTKKCEIKAWKKFTPGQDSNPWALWYQFSALPTELSGQLVASHWILKVGTLLRWGSRWLASMKRRRTWCCYLTWFWWLWLASRDTWLPPKTTKPSDQELHGLEVTKAQVQAVSYMWHLWGWRCLWSRQGPKGWTRCRAAQWRWHRAAQWLSNNIEQTWGICDWPWRITRSTKDSKCKDFICDYVTKSLSSFSVLIYKLFFITVVLFYFLLFGLFSNISLLSLHILFWYGMSLVVHSHTLLF